MFGHCDPVLKQGGKSYKNMLYQSLFLFVCK